MEEPLTTIHFDDALTVEIDGNENARDGILPTGAGDGEVGVEHHKLDAFVRRMSTTLTTVVKNVRTAIDQMEKAGTAAPQSVEISFGLKITATGDVWVAKASAANQLTVRCKWTAQHPNNK